MVDVESHGFELGDEASLSGVAGTSPIEVVAAEFVVELAGGEQVPGDDEYRVSDRDGGASGPSPTADPVIVGGQVGVLGSSGGLAGFDERDP